MSVTGKVATATPHGATTRVPPTPTFERGLLGLVAAPAEAAEAEPTGTPAREPRPTRTPQPTVAPYPTLELPPRLPSLVHPPATRTPGPPTAIPPPAPTRTFTPLPAATPVDPNERAGRNDDLTRATALAPGRDLAGLISGPDDVDVYAFEVDEPDGFVAVRLTGPDADSYRVVLLSPGQLASVGATRASATVRRARVPVRAALGTWYVEVSAAPGRRLPPAAGYTLRVEVEPAPPPLEREAD